MQANPSKQTADTALNFAFAVNSRRKKKGKKTQKSNNFAGF